MILLRTIKRLGAGLLHPFKSMKNACSDARTEERVRGFLALTLVLVLIALVFWSPGTSDTAVAAVASTKTLAIAVVAFYFGLHKGTPLKNPGEPGPGVDADEPGPAGNAEPAGVRG